LCTQKSNMLINLAHSPQFLEYGPPADALHS
jgi:hypothetical protein